LNNILTAQDFQFDQDEVVPASGQWGFAPELEQGRDFSLARTLLHHTGFAAILAASPMTFRAAPWFTGSRRQAPLTLDATFEEVAKRPVAILEARQLALDILSRAEHERSRFAEEESRRGIDWESE